MVGPKEQDFWPKINILKRNHCILRIRRAPVGQKLDMILENKVVQKLELEKNIFRLFPIISMSQKFFSFFFLTLEKIGIDEKVICYHNISN